MKLTSNYEAIARRISVGALALSVGAACCGLSGCAVWKKPAFPLIAKTGKDAKRPEPMQPAKLVALWSDSVYYQQGGAPTRGLGGRIYFYDKVDDTIAVDGELIVYAFEDEGQDGQPSKEPVKKFIFKQSELAEHYSPSEFGPSYSFWLPWDSDLADNKAVSVVPVFKDASGQIVMGQHARHRLPGADDAERAAQDAETLPPPLAKYDEPTTPKLGRQVTSIHLPEGTAAKLAQSAPQTSSTAAASSVVTPTATASMVPGTSLPAGSVATAAQPMNAVQPTAYQAPAAPVGHVSPATATSLVPTPAAQGTDLAPRTGFGFQPRTWQEWQASAKQSRASVVDLGAGASWSPHAALPTQPATANGVPNGQLPNAAGWAQNPATLSPSLPPTAAAAPQSTVLPAADGLRPTTVTMGPVPTSGAAGARSLPQPGTGMTGVSNQQVVRLPVQ